jgi:hypothetical protein
MGILYEAETAVAPAAVVEIPAQIIMPELRYAAPSGTLAKDDVIEGTVKLFDKDGNEKPLEFSGYRIVLKDWPEDPNQEILAVLYMNFVVSNKTVIPEVIPENPEQPI